MVRAVLAVGFWCFAAGTSLAWTFDESEDALTDQVTAYVYQDGQPSSDDFSVGIKCWRANPEATFLILDTPFSFDTADQHKGIIVATLRTDGNPPIDVDMYKTNFGGSLAYVLQSSLEARLLDILAEIRDAEDRLVIGTEEQALIFPVRGSTRAVEAFAETCALPLPAPAGEAGSTARAE
jgi:hypothetical protein